MGERDGESVPSGRASTGQDSAAGLGDQARRAIREHASPEGIVTILFTDIVESTRFRQRLGDDPAQQRFRQHNEVVREQIRKHGGFEVKTQGDGFMVAFSDVVAALACTVDIQQAVTEDNQQHPGEEVQVRMGLNCGQAIKEEEDFFGGSVVVAARISALAKGGQILVSEAVRVLAGLPQGIGYVRQGRRRLKGLDGSYDIWSVPWGGEEAQGFAKLWANPAFRLSALVLVPVIIGAGVVGGFVLGPGGGGPSPQGAVFEEVTVHFQSDLVGEVVSGDCISEDMVIRGEGEGRFSGDISGQMTGTGEIILHAVTHCLTGYSSMTFTLTDADGNTAAGILEGPLDAISYLTNAPEPGEPVERSGLASAHVLTITGGTGIYEGATGTGICNSVTGGQYDPDGSARGGSEGDCALKLAAAGAPVAAVEPLIVQLAASPLEVSVSGGSFDPGSTVALTALYANTQEEAQTGLSLRLPVPEGAEILAASLGEPQAVSSGERVWPLPDLPPGELTRFEFMVQILSAETPTVSLMVEVEGEGFEGPVPSDPVAIEVAQ